VRRYYCPTRRAPYAGDDGTLRLRIAYTTLQSVHHGLTLLLYCYESAVSSFGLEYGKYRYRSGGLLPLP
jgi:hypothetical protein